MTSQPSTVYKGLKRGVDISVSATLLVVLAPLILILVFAIRLTSKGPGVYWSQRTARGGLFFNMPKLRTMSVDSKLVSIEVAKSSDIQITRLGRVLRRTSVDELPQLWSVLIGDMSLVGPRPIPGNDWALGARNARPVIYTVRPGITGLAQVRGRNVVKPKQKARYDAFYATHMSLCLDMKILAQTLGAVFRPHAR